MMSIAKPHMKADSQKMLRLAKLAVKSSRPNASAMCRENTIPVRLMSKPAAAPTTRDEIAMRLAS